MNLDESLLEILACPCDAHAPLEHDPEAEELLCTACDRAYPIRAGIPVLLLDEARRRGTTDKPAADKAPSDPAGDAATD
jgi:uncharacterized protein YbaR (Trm112 family)